MKIAIPVFGARVSPRFDCAPNLLFFTVEDGKVLDRGEVVLSYLSPYQRLERVRELGIQALICGGIDGYSTHALQDHKVQVISWVAGEAEEAIKHFLKGDLKSGSFLYSRCRGKRHRNRKAKF